MDSILEYASSPSPPTSPARCDYTPSTSTSPSPAYITPTTTPNDTERIAGRRRAFASSTREEDAFEFRGYVAKRRRRHLPREAPSSRPIAEVASARNDPNDALPLFEDQEIPSDLINDSKLEKRISLRKKTRQRFIGHNKAVNELQWHPKYPNLFLSASMDATVRIWKTPTDDNEKCQRVLAHHSLGVKSAKWSLDGRQILSGGYDGMACCVDAETGQIQLELRRPDVDATSTSIERVTTVCFNATEPTSLLFGTDKGHIYTHDIRNKTPQRPVTTYTKSFGDVHDLLFLGDDGQRFVSSAGVMQRDASNQTLLVWDWRSATLLYDRLDNNMLPHMCLRMHPSKPYFVAQCSGNYATIYSSQAPYKCLKGSNIGGRRFPLRFSGGHDVAGYKIQCSFSSDGSLWASGDASGRVVIYRTSGKRKIVDSFQLYKRHTACICTEFQSSCTQNLLTGSSAGEIDLFQ